MSNNYIEIKKFDIATLSNNQVTDLVGAIEEVKTIEKQAKQKLIKSGLTECSGEYYDVKITPAHEPLTKSEVQVDYNAIIEYGTEHGLEIPMTIDYEKLATLDWVQAIANDPAFLKAVIVKGKAYAGQVKVVKKGE